MVETICRDEELDEKDKEETKENGSRGDGALESTSSAGQGRAKESGSMQIIM